MKHLYHNYTYILDSEILMLQNMLRKFSVIKLKENWKCLGGNCAESYVTF